jgi:hypothetical protein
MWYMYTDTKSPYIMPQLEVKKLLMSFLYTDRQRQLLMDIQSSEIYKRHFCSHASHAGLPRGEVPRRGLVLDFQSRSIAQMLTSSVPELVKIEVDLKLDGLDNQNEEEGMWRAQNTETHGAVEHIDCACFRSPHRPADITYSSSAQVCVRLSVVSNANLYLYRTMLGY